MDFSHALRDKHRLPDFEKKNREIETWGLKVIDLSLSLSLFF